MDRSTPACRRAAALVPAAAVVATLSALAAGACGYRVVRADALFGHTRLAVEPFAEDQPVGISPLISEELTRRLAAGGVRLASDPAGSGAVLRGRVVYQSTRANPTSGGVTAYRVTITVEAELRDQADRLLWSKRLSKNDEFLHPGQRDNQALAAEATRRETLQRLAEQLAGELHDDLVLVSSATGA